MVILKLIGQINAQPGNREIIMFRQAEHLISSFDKFVRESGYVIKNYTHKFGHISRCFVYEHTMF